MICRTWRASATTANAPRYIEIARDRVLAHLHQIPGFRGGVLLQRDQTRPNGAGVSLWFLTFWESMDAIRAFAGEDPSRAVVLPEAEAVLTQCDDTVEHWSVALHAPVA